MYSNDFFCQLKLDVNIHCTFILFFFSRLISTYGVAVITRAIIVILFTSTLPPTFHYFKY